jgi:transcriptional regulator with XRE-family HTH domain
MTVFERVKKLAKSHSKTIKQVTFDLGYSENYFYSLKSGKQPSAEKLQEIADYFNVSVDYLLGRTDNKYLNANKEADDNILERALDSAMSYDGKGISDADRPIIKNFIKAYLESKDK